MVERQAVCAGFLSAILAGVVISQEDIVPIESDDVLPVVRRQILNQADDPGHLDRQSHRPDHLVRGFNDLDLA